MPLKGNLGDFTLPDLFQLIHFGKKTGTLTMTNGEARGYVCFKNGSIYFATHNWKRLVLGQLLTKSTLVSEDQIEEALDLQKTTRKGQRLGNILVELGYLRRESLEVFVREQIKDAVFHLIRWDKGDFDFDRNLTFPEEDIGLSVSTDDLIEECTRRLNEWRLIEQNLPSLDSVFQMTEAPGRDETEINLNSDEWLVLYQVDGESDVKDIIETSGQSAIITCRALSGLVKASLIVLEKREGPGWRPKYDGTLEEQISQYEEQRLFEAPTTLEPELAVPETPEADLEELAAVEQIVDSGEVGIEPETLVVEEVSESEVVEPAALEQGPSVTEQEGLVEPVATKIPEAGLVTETLTEEVEAEPLLEEAEVVDVPEALEEAVAEIEPEVPAETEAPVEESAALEASMAEALDESMLELVEEEEVQPPAQVEEEAAPPPTHVEDEAISFKDRMAAILKKKEFVAAENIAAEQKPPTVEAGVEEAQSLEIEVDKDITEPQGSNGPEPATGQSLVDYYKSLAMEEASDEERLGAFTETEEKKTIELRKPEEVSPEEASEFEALASKSLIEEEALEDIPLEWAGHLARLRGIRTDKAQKIEPEVLEPEVLEPGILEPAAIEPDLLEAGLSVPEPEVLEEPAASAAEPRVAVEESAEVLEEPAAPEPFIEVGEAVVAETAPPVEEAAELLEIPTEQEVEAETAAEAASAEPVAVDEEGQAEEVIAASAQSAIPEFPLVEERAEAEMPLDEDMEKLLEVTDSRRGISREELLAFDQPTYPHVEVRKPHTVREEAAAGIVEAIEEVDEAEEAESLEFFEEAEVAGAEEPVEEVEMVGTVEVTGETETAQVTEVTEVEEQAAEAEEEEVQVREAPEVMEVAGAAETPKAPAEKKRGVFGRVLKFGKKPAEETPQVELDEPYPVVVPGEEEISAAVELGVTVEELEATVPEAEQAREEIAELEVEEAAAKVEELEATVPEAELEVEEAAAKVEELEEPSKEAVPLLLDMPPVMARMEMEVAARKEQLEAMPPVVLEEEAAEALRIEGLEEAPGEVIPIGGVKASSEVAEELEVVAEEQTTTWAEEILAIPEEEAAVPFEFEAVEALQEEFAGFELHPEVEELEPTTRTPELSAPDLAELAPEWQTHPVVVPETVSLEPAAEIMEALEPELLVPEPAILEEPDILEPAASVEAIQEEAPVVPIESMEPETAEAPTEAEVELTELEVLRKLGEESSREEAAVAALGETTIVEAARAEPFYQSVPPYMTGLEVAPAAPVRIPEPDPPALVRKQEPELAPAASAEAAQRNDRPLPEEDGVFADTMQIGGKRGKGTSLVDLETFELEQELLEFAKGRNQPQKDVTVKQGRGPRAAGEKKDGRPAIPVEANVEDKRKPSIGSTTGAAKGRGKKEVDKKAVRKIIKDLKKM